ncbi:MAG TPA: response regulator [Pyrinomonadaceae bacterium]|nr:response regulator [Pyrinomonadaceae bacterium]
MNDLLTDQPINILMVDDSATNLLALESILRMPDRNLVRASSGEDALRYLLDNDVAVVLLDVYMPGIDGLETAELIRSREKSRDIPIIFLTANSTGVSHLSRGYSLGAVDYIVKPVDADILRSKVAVFVELFKKNQEIKQQAALLEEKNRQLEDANLARLNMLIDLGQELAAEHDPTQVLARFCRSARRIVGAEEGAVGILDYDGKALQYFFQSSSDKETLSPNGIPAAAERAIERLVTEKLPLRLSEADDLLSDTQAASDSIQSFLGAPILSPLGVSGWLYLLNKNDDDDFSEADERLAATLATQLAVAYENARLYTEAQNHATELRLEVAERKQAEEERAQMLIREQAARAEAETANRTKDEFLATLSHELRTPLTAILGWSHLLRMNKLREPQFVHALETIERNARSQSQLIDDLLDVSRIVTGKLQIEFSTVDLSAVIEAAIESIHPALAAKGLSLETVVESGCRVLGDANRLQQIFWNLFTNAIKFTPKGGQVKVTSERRDSEIRINVTDSGIGISPEFLPYIFDRFRQADGSTTRAHGGLGLGLAIVRHLVELHHGKVEVDSHGKQLGSTFTVRLPIAVAVSDHSNGHGDATQIKDEDLLIKSSRILDGLKILVVDDDPDTRDLVRTILTRCGSEVRCSESAADALLAFQEWNPDLLVSDIGMPLEDGYGLIRRLRKLKSRRAKQIPALALTAYATDEDRSLALSAGFQMHLPKPIEPESLVSSIAAALGRNSSS